MLQLRKLRRRPETLVSRQVAVISAWSSAVSVGCQLRQWSLKSLGNHRYEARQISTDIVELVKTASACRQSVMAHEAGAKMVLTPLEKAVHVGEFDALVDIAKLAAEVLAELDAVLGLLAASFTKDATDLMRMVRSKYPPWLVKREMLLDDAKLGGALLKSTEQVYLQPGPVAKELRRIVDHIGGINGD